MNKKKPNVVFDWTLGHNNVVLNFMRNAKAEFRLYGDTYHEAAKKWLTAYKEAGGRSSLDACPIVFLYRHALELNLKSIIIRGNNILELHDEQPVGDEGIFSTHSLTELMAAVEKIVTYMGWQDGYQMDCIESFADCKTIAADFDKIDPGSYAFRYPTDKRGRASVSHHFGFDLRLFVARLDPVIELMSCTAYALDHEYDGLCEALADARQAAMEYEAEHADYGEY